MMALLDAPDYHLSPREKDVARLLLGGLPNKSIGRLLSLETQTVKNHMSAILRKTGSHNRVMAALQLAGYGAQPPT